MTPGSGHGLRVVQVVCSDGFAGVERYVAGLATGLAARGCEVSVLGGSAARMPQELLGAAIDWSPVASPAAAARRLLRHRRADIVHSHMTAADLAATLTRPLVRAPVVSTRHFTARRGSSPAGRLAGRLIGARMSAQIAISEAVGRAVEGDSVVVPTGVPAQPCVDERAREPIVLVAQRLEAEKRTDLALHVWARSGLADRGWRLLVAGDGSQRGALLHHADSIGATGYEFIGEQPSITPLLARASVLLAPCSVEALGLSVIEAMSMRVPVVAVSGGGHDETVGRARDAALFPAGDVDAGAQALRELADDAPRRARYGAELARIQQRELSRDAQVERTLAVYRSVLR